MKIRQGTKCAYCGVNEAKENEHVIPRSLFSGPLPSGSKDTPVKVPACFECNKVKAKHDDRLRDALVSDIYAHRHPQVQRLVNGTPEEISHMRLSKVQRAWVRNQSQVLRQVMANPILRPHILSNGKLVGYFNQTVVSLRIPLTMILRGLYYHQTRERLPDNASFLMGRIDEPQLEQIIESIRQQGCSDVRAVGDVCEWIIVQDETTVSSLIGFYQSIFFIMQATLPDKQPEVPESLVRQNSFSS